MAYTKSQRCKCVSRISRKRWTPAQLTAVRTALQPSLENSLRREVKAEIEPSYAAPPPSVPATIEQNSDSASDARIVGAAHQHRPKRKANAVRVKHEDALTMVSHQMPRVWWWGSGSRAWLQPDSLPLISSETRRCLVVVLRLLLLSAFTRRR